MSAKIWKHSGGTKPTVVNGMKFGNMKCLSRLKRSTRRAERHSIRDVIQDQLDERGVASKVPRDQMPLLNKVTGSTIGVTGYAFHHHRIYLD